MKFQTAESRHCRICQNGLAHLLASYFIFRVLDVFKTGDLGRYEYIELNDDHLKAVSGRPVILHVFIWDDHMPCSLHDQQGILNRLLHAGLIKITIIALPSVNNI